MFSFKKVSLIIYFLCLNAYSIAIAEAKNNILNTHYSMDIISPSTTEYKETCIAENSYNARHPMVKTDANFVYIIFDQDGINEREIYFVRSTDGGRKWQGIRRLTDDDNTPSTNPTLEIDIHGTLHLAWRDKRGGTWSGWYMKSIDHGQTWTNPVNVTKYKGAYEFTHPIISMTSDADHLYMVWNDNHEGGWHNLYYSISANGNAWTDAKRLTNKIACEDVAVATDGSGTLHAGWRWHYFDQQGSIYKRSLNYGQSWEDDIKFGSLVRGIKPCANTQDELLLIYPDSNDNNIKLYSAYSDDQGRNFEEPIEISTNAFSPYLAQNNGAVACQGSDFYVVWRDYRHGENNPEIYLAIGDKSGAAFWKEEYRISNALENSIEAKLAPDGNRVHIVWSDMRDGDYDIFYTCHEGAPISYRGDINKDTVVDIKDALLSLQLFCNIRESELEEPVQLSEVVYILKCIAGMK